jgi:hypothetical protein
MPETFDVPLSAAPEVFERIAAHQLSHRKIVIDPHEPHVDGGPT